MININDGTIYSESTRTKVDERDESDYSIKNSLIKLKNNNYFLTFIRITKILFITRHQESFLIFNFNTNNLNGLEKIETIEETINYIKTTQCFQTKNEFIECIFNPLTAGTKFAIVVFDSSLNRIDDYVLIADINKYTFIKIFHIKEEIGGYVYFDFNTNCPRIQIRILKINGSKFSLDNKFGSENSFIELNKDGIYSYSNELFLSDTIKINNQKFSVILTTEDLSNIIICLFDMYDDDNSIKLRYFKIDLSIKDIKIFVNICGFLFNENIGLAFYDSNSKYPGYMIFGYPNVTDTNKIFLFENNKEYDFPLNDNIEISNNIFGYKINKIKIINFTNSNLSGIDLSSFINNAPLEEGQELEINDKIIFKEKESGANTGVYILGLIAKVEESNYEEYESLIDGEFHYGNDHKDFYAPKIFDSKIIKIYYIIDRTCDNAFHRVINSGEKISYEDNFCQYNNYKYYIDDKNECMSKCPTQIITDIFFNVIMKAAPHKQIKFLQI